MLQLELKTQIFYLSRIFEILSDGYMLSVISFNETGIMGNTDLPFSTIDENLKTNLRLEKFEEVLNNIFTELYNHTKLFTSAPKVFEQKWNNDFVLKSIEETKNNILEYSLNKEVLIKMAYNLAEGDDIQVIEFVYESKQIKEVIFFQRWFH